MVTEKCQVYGICKNPVEHKTNFVFAIKYGSGETILKYKILNKEEY